MLNLYSQGSIYTVNSVIAEEVKKFGIEGKYPIIAGRTFRLRPMIEILGEDADLDFWRLNAKIL